MRFFRFIVLMGLIAAHPMGRSFAEETRSTITAYSYDAEPYPLPPGPHLFIDWRYTLPGRSSYSLPDGEQIPRDGDIKKYDGSVIDQIIATPERASYGVRLEAVLPEWIGPVVTNEEPWEYFTAYPSLVEYEGTYYLYYETRPPSGQGDYALCVATSTDGIHYTKPNVAAVTFNGSRENNIVIGYDSIPNSFHGHSVWLDPHASAEERFKCIYMSGASDEEIQRMKREHPQSLSPIGEKKGLAIRLAVSSDGLHWAQQPEPLMIHMSDTGTTAYYDQHLKRYVGYFRMSYLNKRVIGRSEAKELNGWPEPEFVLGPNPSDNAHDDYYTNGKSLYPGTTTMHFMFPMIYRRNLDTSVVSVASSLDGRIWNFLPGNPIMEPGSMGSWNGGCLFPGAGLAETTDGRVVFPVTGFSLPHKFPRVISLGSVGLAAWPKERIGALVADDLGEIWTTPLSTQGKELYLNFETLRGGRVEVEIEGVDGRSLGACDPLFGNHLKKKVAWGGQSDINVGQGNDFTLHLKLRSAKVYSFEFK